MEIVPILSTIILVGTVATFILAVAAYILYKMREGGGSLPEEVKPEQIQPHHVVMPVDYATLMGQRGDSGPAEASTFIAPTATTPPFGAYLESNNGHDYAGSGTNGHATNGASPALPPSNQRNISLDSFFWDYTEEGFSPLHTEDEIPPSIEDAPETNSEERRQD